MALVAFDDFEWAEVFSPRLTVIAQPVAELGEQAVSLLLSRLEGAARARVLPVSNPVTATQRIAGPMAVAAPANLGISMYRTTGSMDMPVAVSRSSQATAIPQNLAGYDEPLAEPRLSGLTLAFDRLADPATRQLPAFEAQAGRWEELRWSLERIRHRFGEGRLWRASSERPMASLPEHRSRLTELNQ